MNIQQLLAYLREKVAFGDTKYLKKIERICEDFELFTYILSHDLRKPQRVARSNCDIIEENYESLSKDQVLQYVDEIKSSSELMQQMIEKLLDYVRIEVFDTDLAVIDADEVMQKILSSFENEIKKQGITVNYTKLPMIVTGYEYLEFVFHELLVNAIKFKRKDADLVLNITHEIIDKECSIIIEDNGIGIEEEYFEVICLMFQRLHTYEEVKGIGAGLGMVRKIMNCYGKSMSIESVPEVGSKITLTFETV